MSSYFFKSIKASRQNNNLVSMNNETAQKCLIKSHKNFLVPFPIASISFFFFSLWSSLLSAVDGNLLNNKKRVEQKNISGDKIQSL